jgi:hypothetical protein
LGDSSRRRRRASRGGALVTDSGQLGQAAENFLLANVRRDAYDDSATTILSRCSSPVADAVIRLRRASGFMGLLLPGTHESVGT